MQKQILKINNTKYIITAHYTIERKIPNKDDLFGVQLAIEVRDMQNNVLKWNELKGTYLAEKIRDYARNSFNGQNSCYWDWEKAQEQGREEIPG